MLIKYPYKSITTQQFIRFPSKKSLHATSRRYADSSTPLRQTKAPTAKQFRRIQSGVGIVSIGIAASARTFIPTLSPQHPRLRPSCFSRGPVIGLIFLANNLAVFRRWTPLTCGILIRGNYLFLVIALEIFIIRF